jgi:hypothetical protein
MTYRFEYNRKKLVTFQARSDEAAWEKFEEWRKDNPIPESKLGPYDTPTPLMVYVS